MQAESRHPSASSSWTLSPLLLGIGVTWLWYYRTRVCKRPHLVSGWPLRQFLQCHCPVVMETFSPTFWCPGGRLQTIIRVLLASKPHVSYRNEVISTGDGGQVSLDWTDNDESSQFPESASRPTIILLPGLTGNSRQSYILHLVRQASRDGYRCVVFNNRGFGGETLLTHRTFCAANTDDLVRVVQHVHGRLPSSPLLAVGVSLGGMVLLNYLSATGRSSQLFAALVLSAPWNIFVSSASLEQPLNYWLFNRNLITTLRNTTQKYRDVIGKVLDVDHVLQQTWEVQGDRYQKLGNNLTLKIYQLEDFLDILHVRDSIQSRSIRQFDERYTSVVFGFQSCEDYYHQASPCHKMHQIQTPVLCLNAADDPFSPGEALPVDAASASPHVALLITAHGGHIGFLEGLFPNHQSYMDRVFQQFVGAMLRHCDNLKVATDGNAVSS